MTATVFLPGISLPAHVAFAPLLALLGPEARTKELEVYRDERPPADYGLQTEVDGLHRFADELGLDRFHLYGQSLGGSVALAYLAQYPERVAGVALNEPATDFSAADRAAIDAEALGDVPENERMGRFLRQLVRPGVELPPPPPGPPTPEMAKRPAGIGAALAALDRYTLDQDLLRRFPGPSYFSYGTLSNPRWEAMAARIPDVLTDCVVERYEGLHHLDTSHTREPERVAKALHELWARAS